MPTPKPHPRRDGSTVWRVRFRRAGHSTSETFHTQPDAARFCADIKNRGVTYALAMLEQDHADTRGQPTVDDIARAFFEWTSHRVKSDRTVLDYRRDYRLWIGPTFGRRAAATITEQDVQTWVDAMVPKLAPKTVLDRHGLLYSIYRHASSPSRRTVPANPCGNRVIDLPKRRKTEPKGMTPAEYVALRSAIVVIDPAAADLADLLVSSGLRWSEATALTTHDVEDDGRNIHVTVRRVQRRTGSGQDRMVDDTKSEAGMRRVQLDADTSTMVRARVSSATLGGLVMTNSAGTRWHYSNFRNRVWLPAVKASNLARKPSPHWLRHTHVYWLVLTGKVSLPELQSRIGHESIATTISVYGRMITDVQPGALDAFAALRESSRAPVTLPPAR